MSAAWQVAQTVSEAMAVFRQQHVRLGELLSTLLGTAGPRRPYEGAALSGGAPQEHQGPFQHDQGPVGACCGSVTGLTG